MGTPNFARNILETLISNKKNIVAVYTQAPKPAKRGQELQKSPVHLLAEERNLQVFTPQNLKNEAENIKAISPDIILVVAYGMILPKEILEIPKFGCFNVHPSLLPRWRGASPIEHTIMYRDDSTACAIIKMELGLDVGDIALEEKIQLNHNETINSLSERLGKIGADLCLKLIDNIHNISPIPQSKTGITYAKKITNADYLIDFNQPSSLVEAKIRALNGCYFLHSNKRIKILACDFDDSFVHQQPQGKILDKNLHLSCKQGIIKPLLLQKEGGKILPLKEFLNGFKVGL